MPKWRRTPNEPPRTIDGYRPEELDFMLKFIRKPHKTEWRRHLDPLEWWHRGLYRLHSVHHRTGRWGRLLDFLIYIGGPARYSRKMMRRGRRRQRRAMKAKAFASP